MQGPAAIIPLLDHTIPFVLVAFRLAGLCITTPMLSSSSIPARFKIAIIGLIAAAVYPMLELPQIAPGSIDLVSLLPLLAMEAAIGLILGLFIAIPMVSLEMSGVVAGYQLGLGLARTYNPEADMDSEVLGQMLFSIATASIIALGGLEAAFGAVIGSFRLIPLGGFTPEMVPLDVIINLITAGMELALRIAAPVIGAIMLVILVLGAVTKTMPQINIMTVGFAFKVLAGLGILAISLGTSGHACGELISDSLHDMAAWIGG